MPKERGRGTSVRQAGFLPFWKKVEEALNDFLRTFVIEGNTSSKHFVIDDDKVHRASGRHTDRCGLKEHQHVRDNRRGFTNHQLVQSASQFLAGVRFDGFGDTTVESTMKLIEGQLIPSAGNNAIRKLTNVGFALDRGYVTGELIEQLVTVHGADIDTATWKRGAENPITYDQQPQHDGDKRLFLNKNGHKSAIRLVYRPATGKSMTAHGYINGNGSVALGLSTVHQNNQWEFVLLHPADRTVYEDPVKNKIQWYRPVKRLNCDEECKLVMNSAEELVVKPLLWENNHLLWFLLRILSITSSTSDRFLTFLDRLTVRQRELIGIDDEDWRLVSAYLQGMPPAESEFQGISQDDFTRIEMNVANMLTDETAVELLMDEYDGNQLDEPTVRAYVKVIGGKSTGSITEVRSRLQLFFDTPWSQRPYILRTDSDLCKEAQQQIQGWKRGQGQNKKS
jgi:hypothetical protein